jgi:hypothetical protein
LATYSLGFGGVAGAGEVGRGVAVSGTGGAAAAAGGLAGGAGAVGAVDGGKVGAGADAGLVMGRFGQPASNRADVKPHTNSRAGRTGLFIVGWLLH